MEKGNSLAIIRKNIVEGKLRITISPNKTSYEVEPIKEAADYDACQVESMIENIIKEKKAEMIGKTTMVWKWTGDKYSYTSTTYFA